MKVTYIAHSGFLVELDHCAMLFDYYEGEIPSIPDEKILYVFVSHKHMDHYNWEVWNLRNQYSNVKYIISKDVPFSAKSRERLNITENDLASILRVYGNNQYEFDGLIIHTLKSTDEGVAFLVNADGTFIYHAGDLHLWIWSGESEVHNEKMEKCYREQIGRLKELLGENTIQAAFLPLDMRQEELASNGMEYFLETIRVKEVYPMHCFENYAIVGEFAERAENQGKDYHINLTNKRGLCFECE